MPLEGLAELGPPVLAGLRFWGALIVVLLAARGEPVFGEIGSQTIISSTHRVVVSGSSSENNLRLALWAEEWLDRVAAEVGRPPVFVRALPLRVRVSRDPAVISARSRQARSGRDLHQELEVPSDARITPAMARELCGLILNRYAFHARRGKPARRVPDWLVTGLAFKLAEGVPESDKEAFLRSWREGGSVSIEEVLTSGSRAAALKGEMDVAAVALVGWMVEAFPDRALLDRLITAVAAGEELNEAWLMEALPGFDDPVRLRQSWDLWIAGFAAPPLALGEVTPRDFLALDDLLSLKHPKWMVLIPSNTRLDGGMRGLAAHRGQDWLVPVAEELGRELRKLQMGKPLFFREVIDGYLRYIGELLAQKAGSRGDSRVDEAHLSAMKRYRGERERYLGRAAAVERAGEEAASRRKEEIEAYLDSLEEGRPEGR